MEGRFSVGWTPHSPDALSLSLSFSVCERTGLGVIIVMWFFLFPLGGWKVEWSRLDMLDTFK